MRNSVAAWARRVLAMLSRAAKPSERSSRDEGGASLYAPNGGRKYLNHAERQRVLAAAERHLAGLLTIAPDPGGMHLIAMPVLARAKSFDDIAVTRAAAAAGLVVQPLSVCYANRPKRHGLILGYAGTPEAEIEAALAKLRGIVLKSRGR